MLDRYRQGAKKKGRKSGSDPPWWLRAAWYSLEKWNRGWIVAFSEIPAWPGHKRQNPHKAKREITGTFCLTSLLLLLAVRWCKVSVCILQQEGYFLHRRKPPNYYKPYYILCLIFLLLNRDKTIGQSIQLCLSLFGTKSPYCLWPSTHNCPAHTLCSPQVSRECKCACRPLCMREKKSMELLLNPVFYAVMLSWTLTRVNK